MENKNIGIDLVFDGKYKLIRDEFAKKYFNGGIEETCIFALSLGILKKTRIPREVWESKGSSWSDLNRMKGKSIDFEVLFDYMGLYDGEISTNQIMGEYVSGGLKLIDEDLLVEDGSLNELKNQLNTHTPLSE